MHIMEEEQVTVPIPTCTNVPAEIAETSTIVEEGPRICPLCNSIVKHFFVNLNEKILMCENIECEFPFGHEDLQFAAIDGCPSQKGTQGRSSAPPSSFTSGSVVSAAEWSEIDKINRVYEDEDTQSDIRSYTSRYKCKGNAELTKRQKEQQLRQQIEQNVKSIKHYTKVLHEDEEVDVIGIRNEKWIKELLDMQKASGLPLVSKQELNKLKKKEPHIGLGELKIDIGDANSLSSIKIEISQNNTTNS